MKKITILIAALAFCAIASQNASAQAHMGLEAMGVQAGLVSPENSDATAGFAGVADWGTMAPNLRLASYLDFWSKSEGSPFGDEATVSDIAFSTRGKYMFPVTSPKVQPFMGVGLGMHFLHVKVETPNQPTLEDSETKLGLDIGGGFAIPISPKTDFNTETWYTVVEDFSQLSLKLGLSFKLGS